MSDNEEITPGIATPGNPPTGVTEIMLQMQRQQLELQQQMTVIMSQLIKPNAQENKTARSTKPTRPIIDADSSDNKWIIFKDSWNRYKEMVGITEEAILMVKRRRRSS